MPQLYCIPARREWTPVPVLGVSIYSRVWETARDPLIRVPVVLVAGLGASSRYWTPFAGRLASVAHVFAPDLPGFGRTPRIPASHWPAGPDPTEQANHLLAWMDARGITRATLVGHSVGCQTVVEFALQFPQRVHQLVLVAPTHDARRRTLLRAFPRLVLGALFEKSSIIPFLAADYFLAGPGRVLQQAIRTMADAVERKLPRVQAPTLVLRGEFDTLVSQRWAEQVTTVLPVAQLVVIERAGHAPNYTAAAVTENVIRNFLVGTLDLIRPPADRTILSPIDDPQRDPCAPRHLVSPIHHASLNYLIAATALALPRVFGWKGKTGALLSVTAVTTTVLNLMSDARLAVHPKVPPIARVQADMASGALLLLASVTSLRREPRLRRFAVASLGACQIAAAAIAAVPTGPARFRAKASFARRP